MADHAGTPYTDSLTAFRAPRRVRGRFPQRRQWLVFGVLWLVSSTAVAEALADCRAHEHDDTGRGLAACTQALSEVEDALTRFEVLARLSDLHVLRGEYAQAQTRLDEAAAQTLPVGAWEADYRLQRRRGLLAFRQRQFGAAMPWFLSASRLAARHAHLRFQAISANDESLVLRQTGDLAGALDALMRSLSLQRQTPEPDLAPILNNIGDIYREQEAWAEADRHYAEAEALYQARDQRVDVAHTQERRALVAAARGDLSAADQRLLAAFQTLSAESAHTLAASVLASRLEVALTAADPDQISARVADLRAYTQAPLTAHAALLLARAERQAGRLDAADGWLDRATDLIDQQDVERLEWLRERALLASAARRPEDAARYYADALSLQQQQTRQRAADSLAVSRVRYEVVEKERALAQAAEREAQVQLQVQQLRLAQQWLWGGVALALIALLALAAYGRHRRRRLREEAALAVRESRAHYRWLEQRLQLQSAQQLLLLQVVQAPALLLDEAGGVISANAAAVAASGVPTLAGQRLLDCVVIDGDGAVTDVADLGGLQMRWRADPEQRNWQLQLHTLAGEAGSVLLLRPAAAAPQPAHDSEPFWSNETHRRALVELMRLALALFETATGKTRIDLAERSRIWRVTVDDGRLRVRAMERYLSLARLPQQPRWREVLRTAYYVLSECDLEAARRVELATKADALRAQIDALGGDSELEEPPQDSVGTRVPSTDT
ncbi:MAG: tetratricopeptide repeat protein [Lysobacterales bacterium]